ncbi:histidine--tRNA ligase [Defluviitalea saccharophila]|uniref:Histidine--tRNA ligase n=1 Tax=Defluviitalea saccharophila TaxID=879970 RepID=A0ABZ2YAG3_9FIRM|nr:histidine--tRNA ligase [Candidatus Epulonipiscium sp.]
MLTKAPRGTKDLFGSEIIAWQEMEQTIRELCKDFGYGEIRTPMFEHTELFQRGVGETTDIVQKEMYSFQDKKGRNITLKPEGTAGAVRAYLEQKMYADTQPTKLYYITPAFRYEKPQAGRMRQFHQFGIELLGADAPTADVEVITVAAELLKRMGISKVKLHINSLGGPECRKKYNEKLREYLGENLHNLCETCKERFEKNPLRVLDCKNENCGKIVANAPTVLDTLGEECKNHFEMVKTLLDEMGIEYTVDPGIVRGLDYYTRTVFEFISTDIGAQGTICGGGRYNNLVEELGGSPTPAVGFAVGLERLLMVAEAEKGKKEYTPSKDIFIGSIGESALIKAHHLVYQLRQAGISAEADHLGKSVKAQMKYGDKIGAKYSMILGDDEINAGKAVIKNMETREQTEVVLSDIVQAVKGLIG